MLSRAALCAGVLAGSLLSSATAGEFAAPRRFAPDEQARALPTVTESETVTSAQWNAREKSQNSAFETTTAGNPLRWRIKQNSSPITTASRASSTSSTTGVVRASFAERARAASRVPKSSALNDPFGDRKFPVRVAQAVEPAEEMEEGSIDETVEQPVEGAQDFNPPGRFNPSPTPDAVPEPESEPAPEAAPVPPRRPLFGNPRQPLPPAQEPMDALPEPEPEGVPPTAKYNDRNCAVDNKSCEDHRSRIKSDVLIDKDDLINITAPLSLSTDTDEQRERALQNFNRIPSRQWRNRAGEIVAEGRLREVAYRYAVINDASGQPVKIKLNDLGDDELCFLSGWWNTPAECILGDEIHPGRNFVPSTMTWTASALCHKPLYFEEVQVERYGHTAGIFQPALSGAHFFINIAVLPYKMGINPPNECQYALGYYRPGSCAPWMIPPVPLSVRGAVTQAAAVGLVAPLIP